MDSSLVIVDTISINGEVSRRTLEGTYTVESDCTGSYTLTNGNTADLVIVSGGSEVFLVDTDDLAVITGDLKRQ